MPFRVPMKICSVPSESSTAMTASPSSTPIAMMPSARGFLNEVRSVFLMTPLRVPITTNCCPSSAGKSFTASSAAIFSPSCIETRLAIALPLPPAPASGIAWTLQPVGTAAVRENHDVRVCRRDEQMADEILLAGAHADAPLAAAALHAVGADRGPLDVAGVGNGDRNVLVGDQILDAELAALVVDDLGAAFVEVSSRGPLSAR